jgi:hypothetical protein
MEKWVHNFAICWDWLKNTVDFIEIGLIGKSVLLSNQQETCLEFNGLFHTHPCLALAVPPHAPRGAGGEGQGNPGKGEEADVVTENFMEKQGSSETYTQSSELLVIGQIFDSVSGPPHKKPYPLSFIEWFVGFSEGDGCFGVNYVNNRVSFVITQKNPQVLFYIKKTLGFGLIHKSEDNYYRYTVSKKVNLIHLIKLFSGRLVLEKTNSRFTA